jgi:hypothetical protein
MPQFSGLMIAQKQKEKIKSFQHFLWITFNVDNNKTSECG